MEKHDSLIHYFPAHDLTCNNRIAQHRLLVMKNFIYYYR